MSYRCVATSIGGFVQQLAVCYMRHGYWFYVTGSIPSRKNPSSIDQKLIQKYGIDLSKYTRARKKRNGQASIQYLRYDRFFLLAATHGHHHFFEEEGKNFRDARRYPIHFHGYSIGWRAGHPRVSIERSTYKDLKAYFLELALHRKADRLAAELHALPYEPYAPVRSQLLCILRAVNRSRKKAGFKAVPSSCLRFKRHIYRPFEPYLVEENP